MKGKNMYLSDDQMDAAYGRQVDKMIREKAFVLKCSYEEAALILLADKIIEDSRKRSSGTRTN